jgi:hypothetical protein
MKVVLRSSSLLFTVLSIVLNAPITRVKRKPETPAKKPAVRAESPGESEHWNRLAS